MSRFLLLGVPPEPPGSASSAEVRVVRKHGRVLVKKTIRRESPGDSQTGEPAARDGFDIGAPGSTGQGGLDEHSAGLTAPDPIDVHSAGPTAPDPNEARDADPAHPEPVDPTQGAGPAADDLDFRVEDPGGGADRLLIIHGMPGGERRIPVPLRPAAEIVRGTRRQGLLASGLLLLTGLLAAGIFAHRMTQPLRRLSTAVDALGRGELGTQIDVTGHGEVADLQRAFNRMSIRLAELEAERDRWRAREHLAELGELSRGLGHTLRNPLNTLGLVVEELAARIDDGDDLVSTARGQIRRIDGWLRSFLAVGAGQAAEPELLDLVDLASDVVLEAVQQGARIEVRTDDGPIRVRGVAAALRAALSNLVGNAVEASLPLGVVEVAVSREDGMGVIRIVDHGPGLPAEVRTRLFSPHVTTRTGGSGMGLFLARQLIEGAHGGRLELGDAPGGGTQAVARLPLAGADET